MQVGFEKLMEMQHTDEIMDPYAKVKNRRKKKRKAQDTEDENHNFNIRKHGRPYTPELITPRPQLNDPYGAGSSPFTQGYGSQPTLGLNRGNSLGPTS